MQIPAGKAWIAVDWGTSRMRVWQVTESNANLITDSGPGMNHLNPDQFESTLLKAIEPVLLEQSQINDQNDVRTMVLACGMVGAKQGWQEAPYRSTPCMPVSAGDLMQVNTVDKRIAVFIIPGLCQHKPADVMRGEETLIAGLIHQRPAYTGNVCLPGTHCKWVSLVDGRVTEFATTLTGELFQLLAEQSILRNDIDTRAWDNDAFNSAVKFIAANPVQLSRALFSVRAQSLLQANPPAKNTARLSGLLIGSDIASVSSSIEGQETLIIGQSALANRYQQALALLNYKSECLSMDTLLLDGLKQAMQLGGGS